MIHALVTPSFMASIIASNDSTPMNKTFWRRQHLGIGAHRPGPPELRLRKLHLQSNLIKGAFCFWTFSPTRLRVQQFWNRERPQLSPHERIEKAC